MVIDAKVIDRNTLSQLSNWQPGQLVSFTASSSQPLDLILNLLHLQPYVYVYKRNLQSSIADLSRARPQYTPDPKHDL